MDTKHQRDPSLGYVSRNVREGDIINLSRDGEEIGFIEVRHVPRDVRVSLVLAFKREIRISRSKETQQ